jgi:hypothetical protein
MTRPRPQPPAPEELPALYLALVTKVERLEGMARQLLAEKTHSHIMSPTWKDFQEIKADVDRLRVAISGKGT